MAPAPGTFPATRYQGSKRKLLPFLREALAHLAYDSVLDAFSGTAAVAYLFKSLDKAVMANDALACNGEIARALVVNDDARLPPELLAALQRPVPGRHYDDFIQRTFRGLFYLDDENAWLDTVAQNIAAIDDPVVRSLARYSLFQACLAKRPFNLFHRANLKLRTADVERSFGNKATWDRAFSDHFAAAARGANGAVFATAPSKACRVGDAASAPVGADLVYLDPPYLRRGGRPTDYLDFYHFLEGLTDYAGWSEELDVRYKHRPFRRRDNPWTDPDRVGGAFEELVDRHRRAILVISYRDDGIPTVPELCRLLERHGKRDARAHHRDHRYVLSTARAREVLLVAE